MSTKKKFQPNLPSLTTFAELGRILQTKHVKAFFDSPRGANTERDEKKKNKKAK
jgi:hypothetical protein